MTQLKLVEGTDEFHIAGLAMKVRNELGFSMLESAYERALILELNKAGYTAERQVPILIFYEEVCQNLFQTIFQRENYRLVMQFCLLPQGHTLFTGSEKDGFFHQASPPAFSSISTIRAIRSAKLSLGFFFSSSVSGWKIPCGFTPSLLCLQASFRTMRSHSSR